ncbi:MAG: D-2-hydroxyacid dehydrogenase [Gemmatimonadota bacterium]|jgi:phosphoglycerate dehydrogenase-like enzyme
MPSADSPDTILIASWLEPEHVGRIRAAAKDLTVLHHPELLRPPRYPGDHTGRAIERSEAEEARWREALARATILFDFDTTHVADLPERAPRLRWVQATSAGIGHFVRRNGYAERMPDTVFTTASGVHARPLAEFAAMSILAHARGLLHMVEAQEARLWERFAGTDVVGRTVLVVGHGAIGQEVGRVCRALGMTVLGVKRHPSGVAPASVHADELHGPDALGGLWPRAEYVVLTAPHTDETEALVGADELAALPRGAVLINVGRGALVDEAALVASLRSHHLGGAFLDVFEEEPLPEDSPLWDLSGVLVSPHSASTSDRENRRIVDLFCENLRRWRAGEELLNVLDPERMY